ncbi:MAG: hypothetical protein WC759_05390 [Candidatus Micrarchaeia archaeon]|jgi:hypothetical protein
MAVDLKGAKNIGFKWAIWNPEKGDWASVSADKPEGVPSECVFTIDSAIEMQSKGIEPRRRGGQQKQQPLAPLPQQMPYVPPMIPQQAPPTVQREDKDSFFSLPSPEKLAEQQRAYQQQAAYEQMQAQRAAAPVQQAQPRQQLLPTIRPTRAEMITPAVAGGIAMGVIMGIPVLNLCLPAWLLGGFLATFLLLAESPIRSTLAPEDAAKVGAITGVAAAIVSLIVSFVSNVFAGDAIIEAAGGKTSWVTGLALNAMGVSSSNPDIFFTLFLFISRLVLFPLFGALGAVLYVRYGRKM